MLIIDLKGGVDMNSSSETKRRSKQSEEHSEKSGAKSEKKHSADYSC